MSALAGFSRFHWSAESVTLGCTPITPELLWPPQLFDKPSWEGAFGFEYIQSQLVRKVPVLGRIGPPGITDYCENGRVVFKWFWKIENMFVYILHVGEKSTITDGFHGWEYCRNVPEWPEQEQRPWTDRRRTGNISSSQRMTSQNRFLGGFDQWLEMRKWPFATHLPL